MGLDDFLNLCSEPSLQGFIRQGHSLVARSSFAIFTVLLVVLPPLAADGRVEVQVRAAALLLLLGLDISESSPTQFCLDLLL